MPMIYESRFIQMLADQAFPPRHLKEMFERFNLEIEPGQEIISECQSDPATHGFWVSIKIKIRRIAR